MFGSWTQRVQELGQRIVVGAQRRCGLRGGAAALLGHVFGARALIEYGLSEYANPATSSMNVGEELALVRGSPWLGEGRGAVSGLRH